jgi:hypothetical protein
VCGVELKAKKMGAVPLSKESDGENAGDLLTFVNLFGSQWNIWAV